MSVDYLLPLTYRDKLEKIASYPYPFSIYYFPFSAKPRYAVNGKS
jgi:hypothetical protein